MLIKLVLFGFFVLFIAETEENCGLYWNTLKYGHPMFSVYGLELGHLCGDSNATISLLYPYCEQ